MMSVGNALWAFSAFIGILIALAYRNLDHHGQAFQHSLSQDAIVAGLGTLASGISGIVIQIAAVLLENWQEGYTAVSRAKVSSRIKVIEAEADMQIRAMDARSAVYIAREIEALALAEWMLKHMRPGP